METSIQLPAQETGNISAMEQWAKTLTVTTPAQHEDALTGLKGIKMLKKRIVDFFAKSKEAAALAHKEICRNERSFTDKLDNAESLAKKVLLAYQLAEEDKRQKEQARLQAVEDERARKEFERLAERAEKAAASGKAEKADALREQAAAVIPNAVVIESRVASSGSSIKKTWKGKLVSMDLLIAAATPGSVAASFLILNEQAMTKFAIATKGAVQVPGIEFCEEVGMSVRTK